MLLWRTLWFLSCEEWSKVIIIVLYTTLHLNTKVLCTVCPLEGAGSLRYSLTTHDVIKGLAPLGQQSAQHLSLTVLSHSQWQSEAVIYLCSSQLDTCKQTASHFQCCSHPLLGFGLNRAVMLTPGLFPHYVLIETSSWFPVACVVQTKMKNCCLIFSPTNAEDLHEKFDMFCKYEACKSLPCSPLCDLGNWLMSYLQVDFQGVLFSWNWFLVFKVCQSAHGHGISGA